MELEPLDGRARAATMIGMAFVGLTGLTVPLDLLSWQGIIDIDAIELSGAAALASIVYLLQFVAFIASVIAVAMWIHRAHKSLNQADVAGLEFSPGWAVGWYFIPFANLIKPYQAMRELWNNSHATPDHFAVEAPDLLKVWWGTWIVGNILGNISFRMSMNGDPGLLSSSYLIGAIGSFLITICGVLIVRIIRQVTEAQKAGGFAAYAFD